MSILAMNHFMRSVNNINNNKPLFVQFQENSFQPQWNFEQKLPTEQTVQEHEAVEQQTVLIETNNIHFQEEILFLSDDADYTEKTSKLHELNLSPFGYIMRLSLYAVGFLVYILMAYACFLLAFLRLDEWMFSLRPKPLNYWRIFSLPSPSVLVKDPIAMTSDKRREDVEETPVPASLEDSVDSTDMSIPQQFKFKLIEEAACIDSSEENGQDLLQFHPQQEMIQNSDLEENASMIKDSEENEHDSSFLVDVLDEEDPLSIENKINITNYSFFSTRGQQLQSIQEKEEVSESSFEQRLLSIREEFEEDSILGEMLDQRGIFLSYQSDAPDLPPSSCDFDMKFEDKIGFPFWRRCNMFVDESQQTIQLQRKWKNTSIAIKNISRTEYLIEKDKAFLRLVYIVNDSKDTRDNNSSITSFSSSHATTCTSSVLSPTRTTPKIQVRSILLRTKNQTDAIFWSSWLSHMKMTTALKPSYFSQHGW